MYKDKLLGARAYNGTNNVILYIWYLHRYFHHNDKYRYLKLVTNIKYGDPLDLLVNARQSIWQCNDCIQVLKYYENKFKFHSNYTYKIKKNLTLSTKKIIIQIKKKTNSYHKFYILL